MMRRTLAIATAIATVGADAGAGTALSDALTPAPADDLAPANGSTSVEASAADPAGGPDWAVRVYSSRDGHRCVEVARVVNGAFGDFDSEGRFAARGAQASGSCAAAPDPPIVAMNEYAGRGGAGERTAVFGLGEDLRDAVLTTDTQQRSAPASRRGSFLFVLDGPAPSSATVRTTTVSGTIRTARLAG